MPRWTISVVAGMRLGNSAARADLYRSGPLDSPECDCMSMRHVLTIDLLVASTIEREELQSQVSWALKDHIFLSMSVLLGFRHRSNKANSQIRKAVVKFLQDTGRFKPKEGVPSM